MQPRHIKGPHKRGVARDGGAIMFPWGRPVAAAAFRRAGILWLAFDGAANIGIRPTFDPPKELLEPFFFDFSGDLYGAEIDVTFHHFLRGEAKFDSLDALIEQMERDCAEARKLLSAATP